MKFTVKDKILQTLEEHGGTPVSGERLAAETGVSRAAVWKAVERLRAEGYDISAATNRGYRLAVGGGPLSARGMLPFLDAKKYPGAEESILVYKRVESTNKTAKQKALEGAASGTVVLAEEQTRARGRLGRGFFALPRTGLYMSVIIRPRFDMSKSLLVTTAASVAVCEAIEAVCGVEARIKWVNDVFAEGKKVCGILTEGLTNLENGMIDALVVGIGINCGMNEEDFPEEIRETAGSLTGVSRNRLAAETLNRFFDILNRLDAGLPPAYLEAYRERSMVLQKEVYVYKNPATGARGEGRKAKAVDITDEGGLVVAYENGERETLTSGEISLRVVS